MPMLRVPGHERWYLQHHQLYPLLGLKDGQHLPPEGFEPKEVHGVQFKCDPANGGKHRIKYLCDCGRWIPFGRASQHERAHR